jgi:hypothetical protein
MGSVKLHASTRCCPRQLHFPLSSLVRHIYVYSVQSHTHTEQFAYPQTNYTTALSVFLSFNPNTSFKATNPILLDLHFPLRHAQLAFIRTS